MTKLTQILIKINGFVLNNYELYDTLNYEEDIQIKINMFLMEMYKLFEKSGFNDIHTRQHIILYIYGCYSKIIQLAGKMQDKNIEDEEDTNKLLITNELIDHLLKQFFDDVLEEEEHHDILITGKRKFNNVARLTFIRSSINNDTRFKYFMFFIMEKITIFGFRDLLNMFTGFKQKRDRENIINVFENEGDRYLLNKISNIIQTTDFGIETHSAISTKSPYKLFNKPYQTEVVSTKVIRDITKDQFRRYFHNVKTFYVPDDKIDLFYVYMICSIKKEDDQNIRNIFGNQIDMIYDEFTKRFVNTIHYNNKPDTFVIFINIYNSIDYQMKSSLDLISVNVEDMKQIYSTFEYWADGQLKRITKIHLREEGFFEIENDYDNDRLELEDIEQYQQLLDRELREELERDLRQYEDENR